MSTTTTQHMTAEELLALPRGRFRHELVKGELRTMSPGGGEHGAIIVKITVRVGHHVEANNLGVCFGAETGFKIESDPDTVRAPDLAFVRRERIPEGALTKKYWAGAPDLAVEVLSPGDTVDEVEGKVADWLAAGAGAVWVVSPKRRTVTVYRSPKEIVVLSERDELEGGEVLPGFRCRVSEIFV